MKKMMCKCKRCGHLFDYDEIKIVEDPVGEWHGQIAYQNIEYSPCCEDDFEEVEEEE
jgi:hypothetical protein